MQQRQKLELRWVGKELIPALEPRILLEDPERSHRAAQPVTDSDITNNILIYGDNLLALKALEEDFSRKVDFIYIDPPYNSGSAFEHYDDGLEHSTWLSFMRDRLMLLEKLLHPNGVIAVHIDDSEGPYLKALLDEVFGRKNYLITFYVQVRYPEKTLKQDALFNKVIEQVHCYGGESGANIYQEEQDYSFEKFCWFIKEKGKPKTIQLGGKRVDIFTADQYDVEEGPGAEDGLKEIWASGTILDGNSSGRFFRDYLGKADRVQQDGLGVLYKVYGIGDDGREYRYFTGPKRANATKGKYYQGVPSNVREQKKTTKKQVISNFMDFAGAFGNCRSEGGVEFRSGKKPEALLQTLIKMFTKPGDLVLDSFAGSGTTGATAHKLKRQWIMVELGVHCHTHIMPRLNAVIDGRDKSGISSTVNWEGGGGYRYVELAPSLLQRDKWGHWVINQKYNPEMLARAMCRHMGFTYAPSTTEFWLHGHSSEKDFIYVTTATLTHDQLRAISDEVGAGRTLLVCCKAYNSTADAFDNLTLRKIPQSVLFRCEWGRDDYSFKGNRVDGDDEVDLQDGDGDDDGTDGGDEPKPAKKKGVRSKALTTVR